MTLEQSPSWPYSERNGVQVADDVEVLLGQPDVHLTEQEKETARRFATGLFEGHFSPELTCESSKSLEDIYQTSCLADEQSFYIEYFATAEGTEDLRKLGITEGSFDGISDALRDTETINERVDPKTRKQVAINSLNWRKDQLTNHLTDDPNEDAQYTDIEATTVNYNPDKLLDKLNDWQAYRRFYRQIRKELKKEPPSDLRTAKLALVNLHLARVNNFVADLYPSAVNLAWQLDRSTCTTQTAGWADRLAAVAPGVIMAFERDHTNRTEKLKTFANSFAQKLDLVRNGVGRDSEGRISPLDYELVVLTDTLAGKGKSPDSSRPRWPQEVIDQLDHIQWGATELKDFNETVLEEWGILSEHTTTWEEAGKRNGWAPDGKWQVITHPKKKSFSVNGAKGVIWVPEELKRSLLQESPAGALPLSAHELTHVRQTEYDRVLGEQIPLARIKGRRYMTVRETGGILQERAFQEFLGRDRATNPHYLRALQAKLAGGNRIQVARAFYNSYASGKRLNAEADKDARELAVDRSLRLFRNGGHDSQPLDYIEQELIVRALEKVPAEQRRAIVIAGGSLSLKDSGLLHRVGLLELPTGVNDDPAEDVLRIFNKKYLPKILAAA